MRFKNLDTGSNFPNYLNNYRLKVLITYVNTCKSRQSQKGKRRKRKYIKLGELKKVKEPISASCG